MTRPYSVDLRERVVRPVESGASRRATAAKLEVSVSFVIKLMQRWRRRGSVAPDRYGGWERSPLDVHAERLWALLAAEPDLRIRLAGGGIQTSRSALGRFLLAQGLTPKKAQHAAEQERPDVAAARAVWRAHQTALSPQCLVFIDETWATTNMARRHGRARRGQRSTANAFVRGSSRPWRRRCAPATS